MHNEHSYKTCNKCKALNLDINQGGVMGHGQGIYHRSDIPHSTIKHKSHMLDKRAVPAPCASAAAGWWPSAPSSSPPPSACWAWWPSVRPWPPPPCPDIRCGRKTHRHVWVLEDSKFVFQTQRRKVPLYQDNTRCSVRAAPPPWPGQVHPLGQLHLRRLHLRQGGPQGRGRPEVQGRLPCAQGQGRLKDRQVCSCLELC